MQSTNSCLEASTEGYVVDLYVGVSEKVLVLMSNRRNRVSGRHFGQLLSHVHHPVLCIRPVMSRGSIVMLSFMSS
jgi:hypothetical protein